jgi:hypothetical protein
LTRKHQNHPCLKGLRSHGTQDKILKKTSQKKTPKKTLQQALKRNLKKRKKN